MAIPTTEARVLVTMQTEADRFLPEGPQPVTVADRAALIRALSILPEYLKNKATESGAVIDYRDLVADPAATIEKIYGQLGLSISPEYREVLLAEGKRARQHKSGHSYSLEKFGLDAGAIRSGLSGLFEQYGWDREA